MKQTLRRILAFVAIATFTFILWLLLFHFVGTALKGFNVYSLSGLLMLVSGLGLLVLEVFMSEKPTIKRDEKGRFCK